MGVVKRVNLERADVVRELDEHFNNGRFAVRFRHKEYYLKANNWDEAQVEAERLLDKLFPNVTIVVD